MKLGLSINTPVVNPDVFAPHNILWQVSQASQRARQSTAIPRCKFTLSLTSVADGSD